MEKCIHVVVVRKKKGKEICYCRACEEKSRVRKIKVGDDGWRSIFDRKLRRVLLLPPRSINILIFFLSQSKFLFARRLFLACWRAGAVSTKKRDGRDIFVSIVKKMHVKIACCEGACSFSFPMCHPYSFSIRA